MRYTFQPVFVTSQTQTGTTGEGIKEKLTLSYGAVQQTYVKPGATAGAPATNVFGAWNQLTNSSSMLIPGLADTSGTPRIPA
jgi:hypothetical protein